MSPAKVGAHCTSQSDTVRLSGQGRNTAPLLGGGWELIGRLLASIFNSNSGENASNMF